MKRIETPAALLGPSDNFTETLVIPCMSDCKKYRRLTGWFSSSVLNRWFPALRGIIDNNTKIEILIGEKASNFKIFEKIKDLKTEERKLEELNKIKEDVLLASLEPEIKDKDVFNDIIRYLFANNQLEIKVSFVTSEKGLKFDHAKVGYYEFLDDADIVFEGSANESNDAFLVQGEQLTVHSSSDANTVVYDVYREFLDDLWEGRAEKHERKVISPDEDFIERIKNTNNIKNKDDLEIAYEEAVKEWERRNNKKTLRNYQETAIDLWFKNDCLGILEHATGSGKTFTAMHAIKQIYERDNPICVVGVPTVMLAEQWLDNMTEFFEEHSISFNIIECWDDQKKWFKRARLELENRAARNLEVNDELTIFIVVNRSLNLKFHQELIEDDFFELKNALFVGDECHNYNNAISNKKFPDYKFRLGLSATPIIDEDKIRENENDMLEYFGGIIHSFSISKALKKKFLSPYSYTPIDCLMSDEEYESWYSEFKKSGWDGNPDNLTSRQEAAWGKMLAVLGSLESKFETFSQLIKQDTNKEHTIVFCGQSGSDEDRDLYRAIDILNKNKWNSSAIASKINGATQTKEARNNIIKDFQKGLIDTIAAIRVLDEGIDVPSIKKAYILASSKNRRQFVQRRGRVLRLSENKTKSEIIDLIVQPPYSADGDAPKKLALSELKRIEEMAGDCLNKKAVNKFIASYKSKNGI